MELLTEKPIPAADKLGPARRGLRAPRSESHPSHPVLQLQQDAGNQAVQQLLRSGAIQARLEVGDPGDPAEAEAERTAESVMRAPETQAPCPCTASEGELCDECKQEQAAIRRQAAGTGAQPAAPRIVGEVLRSPGHPPDAATRAFFEPRFGQDLGQVRIHTEAEAAASARAIKALAYTAGEHVVFDAGRYAPETSEGRRLIAHELAHVVQQRSQAGSIIRRQADPSPPAAPQPVTIQDNATDEKKWRTRVDNAVRAQFGLRGAGLTSTNVKYFDEAQFGAQFSKAELAQKLFTLFVDYGEQLTGSGMPAAILDYNRQPFSYAGPTSTTMEQLHQFVQEGIDKGYFEGQTREIDVAASEQAHAPVRFPVFRVTPQELVAAYIGGITDISGSRESRHIAMRLSGGTADVETLVHEACHFYVSDSFRNMVLARPDREDFIGDSLISEILLEGFAEHFARQVMAANASTFGPASGSYQSAVDEVERLVLTLGEPSVRAAYFGGNASQIKRVSAAVDIYKTTPEDLLVPGFVVDEGVAQAAAAAGTANKP